MVDGGEEVVLLIHDERHFSDSVYMIVEWVCVYMYTGASVSPGKQRVLSSGHGQTGECCTGRVMQTNVSERVQKTIPKTRAWLEFIIP